MKNIKVKPYRKRNGDVMLYINDYERRVSFGISDYASMLLLQALHFYE